jgi:hypothetical protein
MVAHSLCAASRRRRASVFAIVGAIGILSLATACEKMPLLAPTGTVITLFPSATNVALNGEIEIIATLIEQGVAQTPGTGNGTGSTSTPAAGTPVHNGTLVTFTSTIGRVEPREARTQNGQVRVRFIAGGQSGTARITAYSGGAVATIDDLLVGTAAAERILVTASPQTLGPAGGTSQVGARVEDASGAALVGVPVTFTTTAGTLSAASAVTDEGGVARTALTTTRESTVTANVAGKTAEITVGLSPRTGISLAGPTNSISAGIPAAFTVGVSSTANIQDVRIDFGDGTSQSLGAISGSTTVQHIYSEAGTYIVRAIATEASGFTEQVSTSLSVLPGQPPSIIITASNNNPSVGETVILTAQVSGATSTVLRYEWNFGADAIPATAETTGNRATVTWTTTGTKIITVRVIQATGPSGEGQTAVVVRP